MRRHNLARMFGDERFVTPPATAQIFGLMLSDSGHVSRRKTARFNVLRIILFFVDWLQLAAIMVSPSTGYTFP